MSNDTQKRLSLEVEQFELGGSWFWPTEILTAIDNAIWRTRDMGGSHQAYAVLDALIDPDESNAKAWEKYRRESPSL